MKVKNYRTFWILLGITVISIPGVNYMLYNVMDNSFPKVKGKSIFGSPFAFPDVWQTVSWNASLLFFIPAILIITLTSNEFTYKTHRQNIIDGWSRQQFITVKLIEVVLLSLLTTLVVVLTVFGFGLLGNKVPEGVSIWSDGRFALFYFVQMVSYSLIAFLLSILIKRAGLAMGLFFIYLIFENIIVGVGRGIYKINAFEYLPEEVTDRLIPQPYLKVLVSPEQSSGWESHIPFYLLVAAAYILVYCLLTSRYFLKKDL
jgi:ABC-type transport system involved in multi-copper enzyme maturation permease subunit